MVYKLHFKDIFKNLFKKRGKIPEMTNNGVPLA